MLIALRLLSLYVAVIINMTISIVLFLRGMNLQSRGRVQGLGS